MKLNRVVIKNYRSIETLELNFDPKCRILVGINESGKTNILEALNLLDPEAVTTRRDLREPGLHESQITEAYVYFIFSPTREEVSPLTEGLKVNFLSRIYTSPIVRNRGTDYKLKKFCKSRQALYVAKILTNKKYVGFWSSSDAEIVDK